MCIEKFKKNIKYVLNKYDIKLDCLLRVKDTCMKKNRHYEMKLARLLFEYGVVPEMLSTQPKTIVNNRFGRSHSVFNSSQHLPCDDGRIMSTS